MAEVIVVGAAILRADPPGVLAACRAAPPALAGLWEFPGGKVEVAESPVDALVRECDEELGVSVEVGDLLGEAEIGDGTAVLRVWLARVIAGEPVAREHADLRWLGIDELDDVPWIPADVPLVEALRARMAAGAATQPYEPKIIGGAASGAPT